MNETEKNPKNVNRPKLGSKFLKTRHSSELHNLAAMTTNNSNTVALIKYELTVYKRCIYGFVL